jgi:hypothetical protein
MQMTVEQARKVWCPQTERKASDESVCTCVATQCALWEWVDNTAMGANRRGECGMKRKMVIIMQQPAPGPKIPMLGKA